MTDFFIFILPLFLLLVLITIPLTTLFHELGHAIPAIILTRQKVSIYIGSYGDPTKSIKFNLGLLEVWFKLNPIFWKRGLCVASAKEISINRQIIYTLTGPLTSFLIALLACYVVFSYDLHGSLKLILFVFLGTSILYLWVNLMPMEEPINMYDGTVTYNDGHLLRQLFHYKRLPAGYEKAAELYNQKHYEASATLFKAMITKGIRDGHIYRLAINSFMQSKKYEEAKALYTELTTFDNMECGDFVNMALCYSYLDEHQKALELYEKSLELDPLNLYALINVGYTLNLFDRFEEAIALFDKAIGIDGTYAYSYNNRGLAKIKLGQIEEGLADINYSLTLDPNDSYAYRNLGIYHLDRGECSLALDLFKKAKEMDCTTHQIDKLIALSQKGV